MQRPGTRKYFERPIDCSLELGIQIDWGDMSFWGAVGKLIGLDEGQVVKDFEHGLEEQANSEFVSDPTTEERFLLLIAKEDRALWPRILQHPNCTTELAKWIEAAGIDPLAAGYTGRTGSARVTIVTHATEDLRHDT